MNERDKLEIFHGTSFSASRVASGEGKHTVFLSLAPPGVPNNNNEIAVRGSDNEETMSGEEHQEDQALVNVESEKEEDEFRRGSLSLCLCLSLSL